MKALPKPALQANAIMREWRQYQHHHHHHKHPSSSRTISFNLNHRNRLECFFQPAPPQPQQKQQFVTVGAQLSYTISSSHPSITSITQAPATAVYGYKETLRRGHIAPDTRLPASVLSEGNISFTLNDDGTARIPGFPAKNRKDEK